MIKIQGASFAETESEFVQSLFNPAGTCIGFAKRTARKIVFMDMRREPVGFVNGYGVIGKATRQPDGKLWYSYGDCDLLPAMTLSEKRAVVQALSVRAAYEKGERAYWFK